MPTPSDRRQRSDLQRIAHRVMLERGLAPDFSKAALDELAAIKGAPATMSPTTRDMRSLPWCSIDNDDSRDLDQLTVAQPAPGGAVRLLVAVAEVAALVRQGSALDDHAKQNTTSVYTAGAIFPMLPEKLSTDLTSLGFGVERLAVVFDMTFGAEGVMTASDIYEGLVRNQAKLAYNSVAAWLDGHGPMPKPVGAVAGLDENIRTQDRMARKLRELRHMRGALSLQTIQARPVFVGEM